MSGNRDDLDGIPSDEDSNDEDYVPTNDKHESESSQSDDDTADDVDRNKSKRKADCLKDASEQEDDEAVDPKKSEEIWSSFLKDVQSMKGKQQPNKYAEIEKVMRQDDSKQQIESDTKTEVLSDQMQPKAESKAIQPPPKTIEKKPAQPPKPSGLANILDKISKKTKISTLEKSRQDWTEFKKVEQIEDELATQNKGKSSYLERKAFLERTDYRQFEAEKELRNKERQMRNTPKN